MLNSYQINDVVINGLAASGSRVVALISFSATAAPPQSRVETTITFVATSGLPPSVCATTMTLAASGVGGSTWRTSAAASVTFTCVPRRVPVLFYWCPTLRACHSVAGEVRARPCASGKAL